jgi:hypothetical protein
MVLLLSLAAARFSVLSSSVLRAHSVRLLVQELQPLENQAQAVQMTRGI